MKGVVRFASFCAALCLAAAPAHAHLGGTVATAVFESPPPLPATEVDLGFAVAPFSAPVADTEYLIKWSDGDNDPTGLFFFYYLPYQPNSQLLAADIEALGTPVKEKNQAAEPVELWVGCGCDGDAGVVCPDAGVRDCRNEFLWDTSGVPDGTYWVVAVNQDPPFHVYSTALAPVRIKHGGGEPSPALVVLRPDGLGSHDKTYRTQWWAQGKPPLRFELAYGNVEDAARGPVSIIVKDLTPTAQADGTYLYDWDISRLENLFTFYLRVRVTDGDGRMVTSNSRYGMSVYHPPPDGFTLGDAAVAPDQGTMPPAGCGSCGVEGGEGVLVAGPLGMLVLLFAALLLGRKRAR
jgi:hypothetical protein